MNMNELIVKKRDGGELSKEEIEYMIKGYVSEEIPDYQMSAMCMAILFKGMTQRETVDLTLAMTYSGDTMDLSGIDGVKVDKHSTGGVGDKTSMVLCPMVAACGLKVAKMSGRGLGHTGGTIDKLESFPGYVTGIPTDLFIKNVNDIGIAIAGQTANLVPADKKMYALRDVTGTVPSIPLMVSSIMSKKIASGSDVIVLDVKCGKGSFMDTVEKATELAENLVNIGNGAGRKCAAVISDMDQPLGYAIGNALEAKEAIATLKGEMSGDLLDLCLTIGSKQMVLADFAKDETEAGIMLMEAVTSGKALDKLAELVKAQGGDPNSVYDVSLLPKAKYSMEIKSDKDGYVSSMDAMEMGMISMRLGGGRMTKDDVIDPGVGIVLNKKVGDHVSAGEQLATLYYSDTAKGETEAENLVRCIEISEKPVPPVQFIKKIL